MDKTRIPSFWQRVESGWQSICHGSATKPRPSDSEMEVAQNVDFFHSFALFCHDLIHANIVQECPWKADFRLQEAVSVHLKCSQTLQEASRLPYRSTMSPVCEVVCDRHAVRCVVLPREATEAKDTYSDGHGPRNIKTRTGIYMCVFFLWGGGTCLKQKSRVMPIMPPVSISLFNLSVSSQRFVNETCYR